MKKSALITYHLLFWIINFLTAQHLFMIAWIMTTHFTSAKPGGTIHIETANTASLIIIVIGAGIFYASYFLLNIFVKRPAFFIWLLLGYVVCNLVISLPASLVSEQALFILGPVLYFNLSGFLFKACVEWVKDKKLKAELEKDRDASQLELLKSKLDPHFLFNNLNNIDVFIQEDPKLASEYLKKLSDILRFMLYEANTTKIPLQKEIEYIRKFIDLQKIRTSNLSFVKFDINGDATNKLLSPMILIHFIENAFKFAANKKIDGAVEVRLDIYGRQLSFYCKNHCSPIKEASSETKGLGIKLLKQKLDLVYKNDYTLTIKEENNWYIVNLDIQLDEN